MNRLRLIRKKGNGNIQRTEREIKRKRKWYERGRERNLQLTVVTCYVLHAKHIGNNSLRPHNNSFFIFSYLLAREERSIRRHCAFPGYHLLYLYPIAPPPPPPHSLFLFLSLSLSPSFLSPSFFFSILLHISWIQRNIICK